MSNFPEIRIKSGWLIRNHISVHLHELWGKEGQQLISTERLAERTKGYAEVWKPVEKEILDAMHDVTGLEFRQNTVDVFIAPWMGAFSSPMIIGIKYSDEEFIDVLTHELLHRLLTDNTTLPWDYDRRKDWRDLFGEEHDNPTLVHIPVHAIHKAIYLDYLEIPERYEKDKDDCAKWGLTPYVKAWNYVDERGYKEIIKDLRKSIESNTDKN